MCYQKRKKGMGLCSFLSLIFVKTYTQSSRQIENPPQYLTFITLKFIEIQEKNIPPRSGHSLVTDRKPHF